jgi:hypothetical protein
MLGFVPYPNLLDVHIRINEMEGISSSGMWQRE